MQHHGKLPSEGFCPWPPDLDNRVSDLEMFFVS